MKSIQTSILRSMKIFIIIPILVFYTNWADAATDMNTFAGISNPLPDASGKSIFLEKEFNTSADGFEPMYEQAPFNGNLPIRPGHPFIVVGMTQAIMCVSQETFGFSEQMIADSAQSRNLRPVFLTGSRCDEVYSIGQWTGRVYRFHIFNDLITLYPFLQNARMNHTWTNMTSTGEWMSGYSISYVDDVDSHLYGKMDLVIEIISSDRAYANRYATKPLHHPFIMLSIDPSVESSENGMAVN